MKGRNVVTIRGESPKQGLTSAKVPTSFPKTVTITNIGYYK